jgi:hypothetical protein
MKLLMSMQIGIQLFQLSLSPKQSGKVEYERERMLGIANKFIHLLAIPAAFRACIRLFRFARGTTLIEIAVYSDVTSLLHPNDEISSSHFSFKVFGWSGVRT